MNRMSEIKEPVNHRTSKPELLMHCFVPERLYIHCGDRYIQEKVSCMETLLLKSLETA